MPLIFVNELFASIQGEGFYTGCPSVFVRLQGCLCQCPWCDTKYTWKLGKPNETTLADILQKEDRPGYATTTAQELSSYILATYPEIPLVVITGGEPCLFDLTELTQRLIEGGKLVQIESSGTEPVNVASGTFVTISPKVNMPGKRQVLPSALRRADEIKMVIGSPEDLALLDSLLVEAPHCPRISLQPLSQNPDATAFCVKTIMERGQRYRLSLQTHKFIHVR